MKLARTAGTLGLLALAAIGNSAFAQDVPPGWYAGASVGRSKATIDNDRITESLRANGFTTNTLSNDDRDRTFKVLGGYQMNKYFALEGGYFDLGEFGYTATTTPAGTLTGKTRMRGINLDLVGRLPVTENLSVFGRVGVTRAQARDAFRGTGAVEVNNPNPRERANNAKFGLGLEYALTPALSARAELERYRINDAVGNRGDIDTATIGLVYRFGRTATKPAPAPVYNAPPAPVYVAPAPAPAPAPATAPVTEKISLAADTVFAFDKSTLTPEGTDAINALVAKMKGLDLEVAVAVGHTDSVGSDAYNQDLSVRRAEAVKAYLVLQGVDAGRVYIEGKGEAQPIADNKTAAGRAENRRVDIEVVGSRTK